MSRPLATTPAASLYRETFNVGHAKYVVSFYSGASHADGSPFYDVRIFSNQRDKDRFIRALVKAGAREVAS